VCASIPVAAGPLFLSICVLNRRWSVLTLHVCAPVLSYIAGRGRRWG